jgi:mRNA interferase RelE/StbE
LAWTARFTAAAEKQLSKLDRPIQRRILAFLEELVQGDPRSSGKALRGDAHAWRYRVGDYRVICDLVDEQMVVYVIRLGHRREVYR